MKVSKIEVEHIAKLAKLDLDSAEKDLYTEQFNVILDYIHRLNELELESVEPTTHVQFLKNVFRKDEVKRSGVEFLKMALEAAPERENTFFKVPAVIE